MDTVSQSVRAQRDAFWDRTSPAPRSGLYDGEPTGTLQNDYGEIDADPAGTWVVATFVSDDVRETKAGSIYTEVHLRVDSVIGSTGRPSVEQGESIDIDIPGGSIISSNGTIREYRTERFSHLMRPGGTYIVDLFEAKILKAYLQGDGWDISSGIAKPVFKREIGLAQSGKSAIAGLSATSAIQLIQQALSRAKGR